MREGRLNRENGEEHLKVQFGPIRANVPSILTQGCKMLILEYAVASNTGGLQSLGPTVTTLLASKCHVQSRCKKVLSSKRGNYVDINRISTRTDTAKCTGAAHSILASLHTIQHQQCVEACSTTHFAQQPQHMRNTPGTTHETQKQLSQTKSEQPHSCQCRSPSPCLAPTLEFWQLQTAFLET
jgi:hypothetical protein